MTQPHPKPFGFTVERDDHEPFFEHTPRREDHWRVELPHQCDAWAIAGDGYEGVPHADAVAELERFITEAQTALAALRERREVKEN